MADVENIRLQMNEIEVRKSSVRQTPLTSFGERLKTGLAATANVVQATAASAGYAIPGGAVVGAAISGLGTVRDISGGMSNDASAGGLIGGSGMSYPMESGSSIPGGSYAGSGGSYSGGGGYLNAVATRAAGGDAPSQMMMATQQMQEMNQAFNLQYLQLQQKMQSESRDYTAMSNIMKTKHDTARNALSNLK